MFINPFICKVHKLKSSGGLFCVWVFPCSSVLVQTPHLLQYPLVRVCFLAMLISGRGSAIVALTTYNPPSYLLTYESTILALLACAPPFVCSSMDPPLDSDWIKQIIIVQCCIEFHTHFRKRLICGHRWGFGDLRKCTSDKCLRLLQPVLMTETLEIYYNIIYFVS